MKLACPSCGARYEKGKFCPECGSPLSEVAIKKVLFCPSCQTEVPSGKFCPECGTKLEEREIEIGAESNAATPAEETSTLITGPSIVPEVESILAKYRDEFGDMRDLNKEEYAIAAEELEKCVSKGNVEAMCFLASLYMDGKGVPEDCSHAYNLLCEAERKGSKYASAILGIFYMHGVIVAADDHEALRRLEEGYKHTRIPGIAGIIAYYYIGHEDYKKALQYAQESANQGDKDGFKALGDLYLHGLGVEQNDQLAFDNYMQAAAQGEETALNQIGWMYQNGCGTEADPEQAFFWYNEAAQKGSDVGMANLAFCYQNGYGVEQDVEVAAEWFKKSAEAGYVDSMLALSDYYQSTLFDLDKAKYWLLKAIERGNAEAMNRLGVIYADDVEPDYKEAIKWYYKAIKLNQPNAFRNLALCYLNGNGVKKNLKKAEELLSKASELGIEDANEIIAEIRKRQEPSAEIFKIWYDCDGHNQINVHSHFVFHGLKGKKGHVHFEITGRKNKKFEIIRILNLDYDDSEYTDFVFYITDVDSDLDLKHDETIDCLITISVSSFTNGFETKLLATSNVKASIWYYFNFFSPSKISIK